MKVDVFLIGDGFNVSDFKHYLDKTLKFKYKFKVVQEIGELFKKGPLKGKRSKFGFGRINDITLKQLSRIDYLSFKSYKIDKISIKVQEKDIKTQSCIYVDKELISVACKIDADIEIVNF